MTTPMLDKNDDQSTRKAASHAPHRRALRKVLWTISACIVVVLCCIAWLVGTESGAQFFFTTTQHFSGGILQVSGVQGHLSRHLSIQKLTIRTADLHITSDDIQLDWQRSQLLRGHLAIDNLSVRTLQIASASNNDPKKLPISLRLPLNVTIAQAALGRLSIARLENNTEVPEVQLTAISGTFSSTSAQHLLQAKLSSPWGQLQSHMSIGTDAPFQIKGQANYIEQADKSLPQLGFNASIDGSLSELRIKGIAHAEKNSHTVNGELNAVIMPYSDQVLRLLQANIANFNPVEFIATAPQANLTIHADLVPNKATKDFQLMGPIVIDNKDVGSLNQARLPITHAQSKLFISAHGLTLNDLRIQLAGRGTIEGKATTQFTAQGVPLIDAQLDLRNIDLSKIEQSIRPTLIQGRLQAHTTASSKEGQLVEVQAQLLDPHGKLNFDAHYQIDAASGDYGALTVTQFLLQSADAKVDAKGMMSMKDVQSFNVTGSMLNFDPSRWVEGAAGRINTNFTLDGHVRPHWQFNLLMPSLQGQYAGQPLQGVINLSAAQNAPAQVKQFDLQLGKNSLKASGIWGGATTATATATDELLVKLDMPDIAAMASAWHQKMSGSLMANARIRGAADQMTGSLVLEAQNLRIGNTFAAAKLNGNVTLEHGMQGDIDGVVTVQELRANVQQAKPTTGAASGATLGATSNAVTDWLYMSRQAKLTLKGNRVAHRLTLSSDFDEFRGATVAVQGGFLPGHFDHWVGQLTQLNVSGHDQMQLQSPMPMDITPSEVHLGPAQIVGSLGKLNLEQFDWAFGTLKTRGSVTDLASIDILNVIRPQHLFEGDLRLNASWNLLSQESIQGKITLERQSGDVSVNDADGFGLAIPLGLRVLNADIALDATRGTNAGGSIVINANVDGVRSGTWQLRAKSQVKKSNGTWTLPDDAPLAGSLVASVPDIEWLGPWLNTGLSLKGKLNFDANLSGVVGAPLYQGTLSGRELEVAFSSEGVLLPNGVLDARIDGHHVILDRLQFSKKITMMPSHAHFRDLNWIGQLGELNASGEVDIGSNTGNIKAQWTHFPLLQRNDRWLVMSGQANVTESNKTWKLDGKLMADGAFFKLPKLPPPSLSSDVMVINRKSKNGQTSSGVERDNPKQLIKTRLDFTLDMGPHFVFAGRGLDAALLGNIRFRAIENGALQSSGSIRTDGGTYEGYGQQLTIERGILNFQGPPANPGLNIRALRQGLAVEAGVEVSGTVAAPQIRLVSEPDVPDTEKLSWLVLGRGSEQLAGNDASLLLSAAGAIFGSDGSRNVPREIVQGLGFDEFSIGTADTGSGSRIPSRTVAGLTSLSSGAGDQVVSIGKRLAPGLVLSVERGLSDASGAIKLGWQVTRRVTIVGRAGTDASVDAYYVFSFK